MCLVVAFMVDTNNMHGGICRRSGDDNTLGTSLQVSLIRGEKKKKNLIAVLQVSYEHHHNMTRGKDIANTAHVHPQKYPPANTCTRHHPSITLLHMAALASSNTTHLF